MSVITMTNVSKEFKRYVKQENILHNFFSREYELKSAVSDISLSVDRGEIVALLGRNGAGKTTTMKLLSGLIVPSSGKINVLGYTPFDKKKEYKKNIALLLGQKQQLWWDIPAYDNYKLLRDIYEINEDKFRQNLNEMVEMLEIEKVINSPIRTLSLGERMKCELVASLLHDPKVLFLDEPTIGLDLVAQRKVRDFLKRYSNSHNATVIITSHNMEDIEELCNRTIFIDEGKKYFDGTLNDFVQRYGKDCILNIEFDGLREKVSLNKYGVLVKDEGNLVKLRVPKELSSMVRQNIKKIDNVVSVIQEELDASEIVRNFFMTKGK